MPLYERFFSFWRDLRPTEIQVGCWLSSHPINDVEFIVDCLKPEFPLVAKLAHDWLVDQRFNQLSDSYKTWYIKP